MRSQETRADGRATRTPGDGDGRGGRRPAGGCRRSLNAFDGSDVVTLSGKVFGVCGADTCRCDVTDRGRRACWCWGPTCEVGENRLQLAAQNRAAQSKGQ